MKKKAFIRNAPIIIYTVSNIFIRIDPRTKKSILAVRDTTNQDDSRSDMVEFSLSVGKVLHNIFHSDFSFAIIPIMPLLAGVSGVNDFVTLPIRAGVLEWYVNAVPNFTK